MPNSSGRSGDDTKAIVITGGTGSFGSAFARYVLEKTPHKIRILSRDEDKQQTMQYRLPPGERVTYILADVRDRQALVNAFDGADYVVHAAALKRVVFGEISPDEFSKTNIGGTANVVEAALECGVKHSLFISSDKAVQPVNEYGRGKAVAEGVFRNGNQKGVSRGCLFSIARGGNVWASRGSVARMWQELKSDGKPLILTDNRSTRFHIEMPEWVEFCYRALTDMHGGEIFIPKVKAWNLVDLFTSFESSLRPAVVGLRSGDKLHEMLISSDGCKRAVDIGWAYVVEPSPMITAVWNYEPWQGFRPDSNWTYTSETTDKLSVEYLRGLVKEL